MLRDDGCFNYLKDIGIYNYFVSYVRYFVLDCFFIGDDSTIWYGDMGYGYFIWGRGRTDGGLFYIKYFSVFYGLV